MDEKDKIILEMLQKNARVSTKKISKTTGIPITTVHNRIKRLEDDGIIKGYTTVLDHKKMGKSIPAYILITVDYKLLKEMRKSQYELAKTLKKREFVEEVDLITGTNDIIVKVRIRDMEQLNDFVTRDLRNIDGVEKTQTSIVLNEV